MTATELNRQIEVSEQQRAELLPPEPTRKTGRAYRRIMNERKFEHLFGIVTHGYRPHAGYVDWSYDYISWWLYDGSDHTVFWEENGQQVSVDLKDADALYDYLAGNAEKKVT